MRLFAAFICAAAMTPVATASVARYGFATPSRNIVCNGSPGRLDCVVFSVSKTCQKTWSLKPKGTSTLRCLYANIGTEVPVLAYGRSLSRSGMRCVSRRRGLTCSNRDHHGFFLSRESQRRF